MLHMTDAGVYYIHHYIPKKEFEIHSEQERNFSRMIWDYKDGKKMAHDFLDRELTQAIVELSKDIRTRNICLVAVPPSKVKKFSPVRASIQRITEMLQQDKEFQGTVPQTVRGYKWLISRTSDIVTSHTERRATYDEQIASLQCKRNDLGSWNSTFIILDDVTTRGTSMEACRDLLLQCGAHEDQVICLSIAATVNHYYQNSYSMSVNTQMSNDEINPFYFLDESDLSDELPF